MVDKMANVLGPELHALGFDILEAFKRLVDEPWDIEPATTVSPRRKAATEAERFTLWAHSLGLYQKGHSSLDYRVRDATAVKTYLADLLVDLKDHLDNRQSLKQYT